MAALTSTSLLRGAIAGRWRRVVSGSVFASLHQAAEAGVPVVIGIVIDRAVATGDTGALVWGIAGLIVLFVGLSFSYPMAIWSYFRGELNAAHEARMAVTRRVLDPRGGVDAVLPGALLSTATGDAGRLASVLPAVVFGTAAVAAFAVAAVVLLRISAGLGLLVVVAMVVAVAAMQLLARPFERRGAAEQASAAQAAAVAADLVMGLRVLKGIGAESAASARYRQASQASLANTLRAVRFEAGYDGFNLALTGVILASVAWVGGRLAVSGSISVGELVAAVGLTQFLVGPFSTLTRVVSGVARARASAGRVSTLLAAPPAVTDGGARLPRPAHGDVALAGVTHAGLRSLDLEAKAGELVGVVAPDPGDATALLACLARTVDPQAGAVMVDGVSLARLNLDDTLGAVLVAAHDARLFEGTLAENVALDGATGQRVEAAMAAAAADEVASSLPDGAGTALTELGRSLSGGQRQRVALARALAVDPPVLVLHDPTTAVDAATEHRIAAGLRSARAGRATLVVTTSPGLLATADRVVLLDGGGVAAEGSHATLLSSNGRYREAVLGQDSGAFT